MCNFRVLIILLGLIFCLIIPSVHSLAIIFGDLMLMIDNLQFTLPILCSLVKIMIFWWKKEAIVSIMNMIAEDWINSVNDQEKSIMIRRAQISRIIIVCSYCLTGLQCFIVVVLPVFGMSMRLTPNITDPGKPMPIQTHYFYDITRKPQYELTFISQAIYIAIAIVAYVGIDNFLSLLIFHVCGQLDIIENYLTHMDKYINYHKILKYCVTKHIHLIRSINIIEDTYNIMLLSMFIYFAVLFAFYSFHIISLFDGENDLPFIRLMFLILTIFNLFVHMSLYCVLGDILMAQCNKIYYAAYCNKWYKMDPKIGKDLLFLITRGSKSIYLTVGKIPPVTMATFCSVRCSIFMTIILKYILLTKFYYRLL
ncbi:odorant receptor 45b [Monomorium pharaonis]|uniref:odorant receptor 45b n=1 Tax=Monomorium pharaonis TaxID=307658 RepID=UPI00174670BB|nr:odorant receptor 45b [Monomorium pharaonis]